MGCGLTSRALTCPRCLHHPLCSSDKHGDRSGRQEGRHKACPYGGGGLAKIGSLAVAAPLSNLRHVMLKMSISGHIGREDRVTTGEG